MIVRCRGKPEGLQTRQLNEDARLVLQLAVATLPVGFAGFLLKDWVSDEFRRYP